EEKTWRMSVKDATSALASLFAIRLLTEEVQEMLAPMMDDFELFLREPGDTSQPDPAALTRNLETKLERFEGLLQQFAAGGLLRDVAAAAQQRRTSANELESFGNYASALLFISVALVLRIDVHDREQRRSVRIAAPVLIRLLHIVLAGEIAIDWPYSMRALNRIDARRPDHDRIELSFPPLAPNLLENVRGLESHLEEAIVTLDAKSTALEVENILLSMLVDISGSHQQASATFRNIRFDHRYRYESAPIEFLQRMVNSRHREQFGSIRNLERRMHELTEYLHSSYGGALPPDVVHDAIMRLREISHESRYRGAAQSELFQRVERMLQESFDPDGRARPLPRARRAKPKNA
ncbi:MAG: hypothetical protein JWL96_4327, partial [Sphingomonas bacterium]|uniref:hypothetical protein n=1 Tax=Sphingomonas bacterium TaxID=1895847 RepID=UPI00261A84AE